jgi:hypothetical protein
LFEFADLVSSRERNYVGDLTFRDAAARAAFLDLRRAALNAAYTGDRRLLDRLNGIAGSPLAASITVRINDGMLEGAATSIVGITAFASMDGASVRIQFAVDLNPIMLDLFQERPAVALAHEMGHLFANPRNGPLIAGSIDPTEYSAFLLENLARAAFGCAPRFPLHTTIRPACY